MTTISHFSTQAIPVTIPQKSTQDIHAMDFWRSGISTSAINFEFFSSKIQYPPIPRKSTQDFQAPLKKHTMKSKDGFLRNRHWNFLSGKLRKGWH